MQDERLASISKNWGKNYVTFGRKCSSFPPPKGITPIALSESGINEANVILISYDAIRAHPVKKERYVEAPGAEGGGGV